MRYAEVVVEIAAENVSRLFTYAVPDGIALVPGTTATGEALSNIAHSLAQARQDSDVYEKLFGESVEHFGLTDTESALHYTPENADAASVSIAKLDDDTLMIVQPGSVALLEKQLEHLLKTLHATPTPTPSLPSMCL